MKNGYRIWKACQQAEAELPTLRKYGSGRNSNSLTLRRFASSESHIADLEEHRARLEAGQPCPLCGSCEHPAVETYRTLEVSANQQRKAVLQKQVEALSETGTAKNEQIKHLKGQQQSLRDGFASVMQQLDTLTQRWQALSGELAPTFYSERHRRTGPLAAGAKPSGTGINYADRDAGTSRANVSGGKRTISAAAADTAATPANAAVDATAAWRTNTRRY
ncbi:hypothetical protein WDV93_23860 [Pantoea ananatis]